MKRRRRSAVPAAIILVGLLILLYPTISNISVMRHASRVVTSYNNAVASLKPAEYDSMLASAREYNQQIVDKGGIANVSEAFGGTQGDKEYNSLLNLHGDGVMGYIVLPDLKESLPIYHGTSTAVLAQGVGHLAGTSLPVGGPSTHAALSGHRGLPSAKLFTDLDKMKKGDVFYIKVLGETLAYKVYGIEVVKPNNVKSLAIQPGKDLVTLITCTPYGVNTHRLLIHAERTPYTEKDKKRSDISNPLYDMPLQYLLLIIALIVLAIIIPIIILKRRKRRPDHKAWPWQIPGLKAQDQARRQARRDAGMEETPPAGHAKRRRWHRQRRKSSKPTMRGDETRKSYGAAQPRGNDAAEAADSIGDSICKAVETNEAGQDEGFSDSSARATRI